MTKLKSQASRDSLLRRMRKQRLKSITVLPSLITILNGLCGFASLVFASEGLFKESAYMLILAMIADMLDGRVARMSQSTSSFGGQLDSLCDIISFGVAPAFLMVKIVDHRLHLAELEFLGRFIWLTAAVYISCAAIRLARFNVENEEDESAHMSFIGLPAPGAAGVVISLVIFHQETLSKLASAGSQVYGLFADLVIYALPLLILGAAILMVSRIRYPHILNQYIKGKKPFSHFIRVILLLGLIIWSRQVALVLIFCGFAASGFFRTMYLKVIHHNNLDPDELSEAAQAVAGSGQ